MPRRMTPAAVKRANGNPGNRAIPEEPRFDPDAVMPIGMTKGAQRVWPDVAAMLSDAGVLTRADKQALKSYCEIYARHKQAFDDVQANGWEAHGAVGNPILRPAYKVLVKCEDQLLVLWREFGMTPSSRARVGIHKPPKKAANKFGALKGNRATATAQDDSDD